LRTGDGNVPDREKEIHQAQEARDEGGCGDCVGQERKEKKKKRSPTGETGRFDALPRRQRNPPKMGCYPRRKDVDRGRKAGTKNAKGGKVKGVGEGWEDAEMTRGRRPPLVQPD